MTRLFFALDVQQKDKSTIYQWYQKQQIESKIANAKTVAPNNYHITLAFLGSTNKIQQQALIETAKQLSANVSKEFTTTLSLTHLGLFKQPKVLYLGIHQAPFWLTNLANKLSLAASEQGLYQEKRPYCPHLTIARKVDKSLQVGQLPIEISIKSFSLYLSESTSTGVQYTPICTL